MSEPREPTTAPAETPAAKRRACVECVTRKIDDARACPVRGCAAPPPAATPADPFPLDPGDSSWLDGLALDADRLLAELGDPLSGRPLAVRLHARGTAFADDLDECHTPAGDALAAAVRGFVATLPAPEPTKRQARRRRRRRTERGTRP